MVGCGKHRGFSHDIAYSRALEDKPAPFQRNPLKRDLPPNNEIEPLYRLVGSEKRLARCKLLSG